MNRRFVSSAAVVLALPLLVFLAGCGGSDSEETARLRSELARLLKQSGAAAKKQVKVGVSIPSADHGWTGGIVYYANKAVKEWRARDPNAEFVVTAADSPERQVGDVEDLMTRGIDALVILPHESAPLTPIVKEAHNKGVFVVVVDRGLTEEFDYVYIAGDNPGLGRVSAEWMAKELNGQGKIVVLEGLPVVINTERVEAFKKVMARHPGIEILDSQLANWSTQRGLEIMENYLQKYQHIDAVWAQDDDVLKGVLQAYKESGRQDIKLMLGGAGSKDIIKMVKDGDPLVRADVTYPPSMVASAVTLGVLGARGENLDGLYQHKIPSKIIIASEMITRENAAEYYEPESVY